VSNPRRSAAFAVIGNPIAHSRSPDIHAAFAAQCGIALTYERIEAPLDGFARTVRALIDGGYQGANVTVPFKLEALALAENSADSDDVKFTLVSARARGAGAANTLTFLADGVRADNTDGVGLVRDITQNERVSLKGVRVLLIGAGGAARGVIAPILDEAPALLAISNRTHSAAEELAKMFADRNVVSALDAKSLADSAFAFDVVINATSASLTGEQLNVPTSVFGSSTLAVDMVYGKEATPFMRVARASGARACDGLGMLVEQAAEAFFIWHGVRPETAPVLKALRAQLAQD
jgi:shikimate dehydrogenase